MALIYIVAPPKIVFIVQNLHVVYPSAAILYCTHNIIITASNSPHAELEKSCTTCNIFSFILRVYINYGFYMQTSQGMGHRVALL